MIVDGAATVETLWAELARAKEKARRSDVAALLKAEHVAHQRGRSFGKLVISRLGSPFYCE